MVWCSIQALLSAPNPDDPLAENVAKHWKDNEAAAVATGMFGSGFSCLIRADPDSMGCAELLRAHQKGHAAAGHAAAAYASFLLRKDCVPMQPRNGHGCMPRTRHDKPCNCGKGWGVEPGSCMERTMYKTGMVFQTSLQVAAGQLV